MGNGHFFSHIRKAIGHRIARHVVPWRTALARAHPAEQVVLAGKKLNLPRTLGEAAHRLTASKPARALFGDAFVDHYAATRDWEEREFRRAITDWEMERYFEII